MSHLTPRPSRVSFALALALMALACSLLLAPAPSAAQEVGLRSAPAAPDAAASRTLAGLLAAPPEAPNMDAQLGAMAERVEGFGGYFYDADGQLTVYLRQPERFDRAYLGREGIRVLEADFDFGQLARIHERIAPVVAGLDGVVFTDANEAKNRVQIGVAPGTSLEAVEAAIAQAGVVRGAIDIVETEPIHLAKSLRDRYRPVPGGVQINFGGAVCTLGFNVSTSSGTKFVTNSHCTNVQGGTEGTQYYQPSGGSNYIGREERDPTYFTGGACPSGRRCRYSDSALVDYSTNSLADLGRIAYTTGYGSLTYSGLFSITGSSGSPPPVGLVLDKVGRTTGWTWGQVTNSCVNINVSGTNITQLCSSLVAAGVNGGDSGSPVFYWSGSGSNVTLYGILWGGGGNSFAFSSLNYVFSELGL